MGVLVFLIAQSGYAQFVCGDTLVDVRDGQKYPTVQIGSQCWMALNLNIGTQIIGSANPLNNGVIEKYCLGDNADTCLVHGGLYTWDEMMNYTTEEGARGICPPGWYIPSDNEIKQLERELGMDSAVADLPDWRGTDQGTQMLEGGSSGLNLQYSGARTSVGYFMGIGGYTYIYSSTQSGNNAWRRCLRTNDARVARYNTFPKGYAFSVRCIKGNDTTPVNSNSTLPQSAMHYFQEGNNLILVSNLFYEESALLSFFDITGKLILTEQVMLPNRTRNVSIAIGHIPPGIYIVHLQNSSNFTAGKIVIH